MKCFQGSSRTMDATNNNLLFNVAQLLKEPVGATRKLELDTPQLVLSDGSNGPGERERLEARDLKGNVKLTRLTRDLLVQGSVAGNVTLQCSRCLDEFTIPVEAALEEKFQPIVDVFTGRPVQREAYEEDDSAFSINPNHEMDLTEPVRQALLVALPLQPLSREDCAGLCPQCGANLNEGDCGHRPDTTDDRWAALRELSIEDLPAGEDNVN